MSPLSLRSLHHPGVLSPALLLAAGSLFPIPLLSTLMCLALIGGTAPLAVAQEPPPGNLALVICVDEHVAFLPSPSVFPDSVFVSAQYPGMPAVETVVGSDGCGALAVPVATPVESGLVSRDFSFASLYPNPSFSGILRAVFTGDVSRLDLFDPAGRQRGALDRVDGSSTLSINRLSSGVYFIRASGPGGHAVRAFVHLGGALELRVDEFPFRAVASADAAGAAKSSSGAQVHVFVRKPGFGVSSSDYVVETGDSVFVVLEPSRVVSVTPVNLLDHYDVLGSGELWVSDLSGTYVVSLSGDSTFVFHSPPSDSLLMAYRNFSSDFPATISSQVFREGVGSYGPVRGSSFGYDTTGVGMDGLIPVSLPPGDVSLSVYAAEDFNDHGETGPFGDRSLWTGFDRFNYFAMMTGAPSLDVWQAYTRPNGSYCWSSDSPVIDIFFNQGPHPIIDETQNLIRAGAVRWADQLFERTFYAGKISFIEVDSLTSPQTWHIVASSTAIPPGGTSVIADPDTGCWKEVEYIVPLSGLDEGDVTGELFQLNFPWDSIGHSRYAGATEYSRFGIESYTANMAFGPDPSLFTSLGTQAYLPSFFRDHAASHGSGKRSPASQDGH